MMLNDVYTSLLRLGGKVIFISFLYLSLFPETHSTKISQKALRKLIKKTGKQRGCSNKNK